jgi:predicted site-specific integrase-resolvase
MDNFLTVKEFANKANKSEETIKRWIRSGKISNAIKESDKKGWKIPESDLNAGEEMKNKEKSICQTHKQFESRHDERDLINLAYQAVTMTYPTEDILEELSDVGIRRTLELLLCMQQSPTRVRNVIGFLKKGIQENWSSETIPIKLPRNQSIRIYELTQQEYKERMAQNEKSFTPKVPFYNWLDE